MTDTKTTSNKYIVVFKGTATQQDIDKAITELQGAGGTVTQKYETVLKGFAGTIPEAHLNQMQSNLQGSAIDYIEPDGIVTTQ